MNKNLQEIKKINNFQDIEDNYDALICDVWGVIHNGRELFESVNDCLVNFRSKQKPVVLLSNAPRPSKYIERMLNQLGLDRKSFNEIVTSGDLTMSALNESHYGSKCYHIGPDRDLNIFDGVNVSRVSFDEADFLFVTGLFDDETEDENSYSSILDEAKKRNLKLVCANPDIAVQRGEKLIPCAGAISKKYEEIGGKAINIGKPFSPIFDKAVNLIKGINENQNPRIIVIGDGLETDIKGANILKMDSLLVLGGLFASESERNIIEVLKKKNIFPSYYTEELKW
ncbi:uncharacterized protein METZ01_LOCUS41578 [marine metagenome]|uniref:Uncharacterized protein n=1 Tax=marine metagenome TaxID=408172 RepID=A0A381RBX7_9ZZZZ